MSSAKAAPLRAFFTKSLQIGGRLLERTRLSSTDEAFCPMGIHLGGQALRADHNQQLEEFFT